MSRTLVCAFIMLAACGPNKRGDDNGVTDGGSGGCMGNKCSADLHDIVDCAGNVVMSCPDGLGCADGNCVDACQSAAANTSSVGCDYYAVTPDSYPSTNGSCFALFVANTWTSPVRINLGRDGQQFPIACFAVFPTCCAQGRTRARWC